MTIGRRLLLVLAALAGTMSAGQVRLNRSSLHTERDSLVRGRVRHALTWMQAGTPPLQRFRFRVPDADRARASRLRAGLTDTTKVLCLRVEFALDTTPLTTGDGKMDTFGFLAPDSGLLYDPPHFKRYFERQMEGVRNYYRAMSYGRLYLDCTVMPAEEKRCYQLPRTMQFYGDTISMEGIEIGLARLLRDALRVADEDPAIHFGDYDEFIVFHAGSGLQSDYAADGEIDSPYDLLAGELPAGALEAYLGEPYIRVDSGRTRIEQATVLPEMMRQDTLTEYGTTNLLGMTGLAGTLTHEVAHLLGAYDLYDVTGVTMGVGGWSLMGYGGWLGDFGAGAPYGVIPGFLDACHREVLGFVDPLVVRAPRESIQVFAAAVDTGMFSLRSDTSAPTIIKIPVTPREYFLIENRQTDVRRPDTIIVDTLGGVLIAIESNEYDFFQPGSGILIWHVDTSILADWGPINAVNAYQPYGGPEHKGVDLEEADGIQDFDVPYYVSFNPNYEIYGYKYDAFSKGGLNDRFDGTTTPSSEGYTGKSHISVALHGEQDTLSRLKDTVVSMTVGWDLMQRGFPVNPGRVMPLLSAFACDIDHDESTEVVAIDTGGQVFAWKSDGAGFRQPNGTFVSHGAATRADPAVGDVAGDSLPEVVTAGNDGRVRVFSSSGGLLATMTTGDRIVAAPMLVDIDGDALSEIVVGSTDMRLYAWNGDGSMVPGFPVVCSTEIRAAAAATAETDADIVVLTGDSRLLLVRGDGTVAPGFPVILGNSSFYQYAQPLVADFDRDGQPEIAAVAGGEHDSRFYLVEMDGTVQSRSREIVTYPFEGRLAAADVDEDGYLDVLCASKFRTYAFNRNGALIPNYPFSEDSTYFGQVLAGDWIFWYDVPYIYASSPVIGDVDNDGVQDVIIGSPAYGLLGFDARRGEASTYFPLLATASVSAVPLLTDIDRDGDVEVAVGSDSGVFYVWDLPGPADGVAWPCAYHDAAHTGFVPVSELPPAPAADSALLGDFYLYPNPAGDRAAARYRLGDGVTAVSLEILDLSGEPVGPTLTGAAVAKSDNETELSIQLLAPGLYVVRAEAVAGSRRSVKFAKLAIVR